MLDRPPHAAPDATEPRPRDPRTSAARPLFAVLALGGWIAAQEDGLDRVLDRVDELVRPVFAARLTVGMVVGVLRDGKMATRGYGEVAKGAAVRPDGETVFRIGSISKVFTGLLLADAVESGRVALDDPVSSLLPETARVPSYGDAPVRLVHLATHTSALPTLLVNPDPDVKTHPIVHMDVGQLYRHLAATRLAHPPGKKYEYGNLASGLLGHALSIAAGQGYGALLEDRICRPLGLRSTRVELDDELRGKRARPYTYAGQPGRSWDGFGVLAGCAGLHSSADDLLRFAAAHIAPGSLPAGAQHLGAAIRRARELQCRVSPTLAMGLGWQLMSEGVLHHTGAAHGYRSLLRVDPKRRTAIVVLMNTTWDAFAPFARQVERVLLGARVTPLRWRTAVELPRPQLERLVGRYRFDPERSATVELEAGVLSVRLSGEATHPIFAATETLFFYRSRPAEIGFELDARGAVTGLSYSNDGRREFAKRIVDSP